ncbi:MAG: head GIN domain-containing protein [Bacteroidia bacterium]
MKKLFYTLCMLCLALVSCESNSGKLITKEKDLDAFEEIVIGSNFEVEIKKADSYKILIQDGENFIDKIQYEVADGKLSIDRESGIFLSSNLDSRITIYTPEPINKIQLDGSGSIISEENWEYNKLYCILSGSGDIQLKGIANECHINLDGSGDVMLAKLKTLRSEVQLNGSGSVEIHAAKKLKVDLNGSGDVEYTGNPELEENINGSGSVSKL